MANYYQTTSTFVSGSKTLARAYFTAPEIFTDEMERIFARQWFCAGHQSRIPNPGDYYLLDAFGESIIILRDDKGRVRAFYNVCRHRGTLICEAPEGKFKKSIQCPYHAWTYGLDGKLIGAALMKNVEGFNKEEFPLHAVALYLWEGFIFLNFSSEPAPFEKEFAPIIDKFTSWNLSALRPATRSVYNVKANWKFIFENYNECYHCPGVHPQLTRISPFNSGQNDMIEGRFLGGYMNIVDAESLSLSGRACGLPVGDIAEGDYERVYYYSLFPNMLLSLHPDYVMFHIINPQSPTQSIITCEWLFHPDSFNQPGFDPGDAVNFWDMTNKQDWHVCELSQAGVASRAYGPSPYAPGESVPAAFDRYYLQMMNR